MSEINLVKFESKAIEKLIAVVSSAIGILYSPKAIRDQADAKAYEAVALGRANVEVALLQDDAQGLMLERARARIVATEIQYQKNIESIADKAVKYLKESNSDKVVDSDWRMRFFEKAKCVTNEEIQEIWAKILANEITGDGSISLRTLTTASNLSAHEAKTFQKVCAAAFENIYFLDGHMDDDILAAGGLNRNDIIVLKDCGLIKHDTDYYWPLSGLLNKEGIYASRYANKAIVIKKDVGHLGNPHFLMFTLAGSELSAVLRTEANLEAFHVLQSYVKGLLHLDISFSIEQEQLGSCS